MLLGLASYGFAEVSTIQYAQAAAAKSSSQAEQYAKLVSKYLDQEGIYGLDNVLAEHAAASDGKLGMSEKFNVGDGSWKYVVSKDSTVATSSGDEVVIAKVDIFKNEETLPRYSMDVPLSSLGGFSAPVGTILPYVGELDKIPGGWALCDGTNGTPNLVGRFLEGSAAEPKLYRAAGLPNITGTVGGIAGGTSGYIAVETGAFYFYSTGGPRIVNDGGAPDHIAGFNASLSNAIYGRSSTVQPASYTVYYIMKME